MLFFGVHLFEIERGKLQTLPELQHHSVAELSRIVRREEPLPELGIYLSWLGKGRSGWAVCAALPQEVGHLDQPLDQFAGDRGKLLRVARHLAKGSDPVEYVGWQVVLAYY